jgi:hypothetical protein
LRPRGRPGDNIRRPVSLLQVPLRLRAFQRLVTALALRGAVTLFERCALRPGARRVMCSSRSLSATTIRRLRSMWRCSTAGFFCWLIRRNAGEIAISLRKICCAMDRRAMQRALSFLILNDPAAPGPCPPMDTLRALLKRDALPHFQNVWGGRSD